MPFTRARALWLAAVVCIGACFLPELDTAQEDGGGDPCTTCASSSCIEESTACFADSACSDLVNCIFACEEGDDACIDDCIAMGAAGITLAIPLAECTADSCADECPDLGFTGSGGAGGTGGAGGAGPGGAGGA